MIERKTYTIRPDIELRPVKYQLGYQLGTEGPLTLERRESLLIATWVEQMHKEHNKIDDMFPIKETWRFEPVEGSEFWAIQHDIYGCIGIVNLIDRPQSIPDTIELQRFILEDEEISFRCQGIGGDILEWLKKEAVNQGYKNVVAKVYCDNPAIKFYERHGFKTYYRYMVYKGVNDED